MKIKNLKEHLIAFSINNTLSAGASQGTAVVPFAGFIRNIYAKLGDAGTGVTATRLDLNKNGTTIFSATTTQISLASTTGVLTLGSFTADPTQVAAGDLLTLDVDAVSTDPLNLAVLVKLSKIPPSATGKAADQDAAFARRDESAEHGQDGRLAAARGGDDQPAGALADRRDQIDHAHVQLVRRRLQANAAIDRTGKYLQERVNKATKEFDARPAEQKAGEEVSRDRREAEPPRDKHLWTAKEYGDFELVVDWRLPARPTKKSYPVVLPSGDDKLDDKGQVVMPNPASSGTGFFDVTAWLTLWGEKGGWEYMDKLHQNIAQYTHSGSKPCNQAAQGEFVVGISFEYRANTNKAKGAPIDLVFPKEGLGWDLEAFAIHKGTKKLAAAKKLADWASSKNAMKLYGKNFAITAQPGVAPPLANVPADYEARLVKMDFAWSAKNRERILAEWTKRYNAKTEKR